MNTLVNYILTISVFIISHVHSASPGVRNVNVTFLDAISTWNFTTVNDPIHKFEKSSSVSNKSTFFLINEQDNLNLTFKDNLNYRTRFTKDLNRCDKLNVTYSFDYFLSVSRQKIIRWSINFLDEKFEIKLPECDRWTSQTDRAEINLDTLKSRYRKKEMLEMVVNTVDKETRYRKRFKSKFAIKQLKLIFECDSVKNELKFDLNSQDNFQFPFIVKRDNKRLTKNQQMNYWSNLVFPKFTRDKVKMYYYTDKQFQHLNFETQASDLGVEEEVCIRFDYFVTRGAYLNVNFVKNKVKRTLIKLYTSEFDERLLSIEANEMKLQWNNATVCVKGEILRNDRYQSPHWSFESFIAKPDMKIDIVAVTNIEAERKKIELKNFIPNWKFNGKSSINSWKIIPQTANFCLNLTDGKELQLYLHELPTQVRRHYQVISGWFETNNTNFGYLTFKVNSTLTNYHLTLKVQTDELSIINYKSWSLNGAIENEVFRYNFGKILRHIDSRVKIHFEIYNDVPIGSQRETLSSEQVFEQQMLIISEIQLADQCTDELICSNNGNCISLAANKVKCECRAGWHGSHCQYVNMCVKEVAIFNRTGNEYCKQKDRECLPDKDIFACKCNNDEFWNKQTLECKLRTNCDFHPCGLNEVCKINATGSAECECGETFSRLDGVCTKDLCRDPKKKCPSNQSCMHVENEVNPICYCPAGTFSKVTNGECIDIRGSYPVSRSYSGINPFVLQKYGCEQDYVVNGGHVKCTCLPGYSSNPANDRLCEIQFNVTDCNCSSNQICIEKDNKRECICRPGYFENDKCDQNICQSNQVQDFCGQASCHIENTHKFVCNCDSELYTVDKNGLCSFRDACSENHATCDDQAVCFNQKVRKSSEISSSDTIVPACGCRRGIGSPLKNYTCADPCENTDLCDNIPFSECKYEHGSDEHVCRCKPGFWRENRLVGPCLPAKSSIKLGLIVMPKNTNVNPVREKNISVFMTLPGITLRSNLNSGKTIETGSSIEQLVRKRQLTRHASISSMHYPCYNNLDGEKCIQKWNQAYRAANKMPTGDLAKNYLDSMLRKQLLDTFNVAFDKKIQDVNVVQYKVIDKLDVENFGLKTFYNVTMVLQSAELELTGQAVREALQHNCQRASDNKTDASYNMCAIGEESNLMLNHLKIEEYDLCESGAIKCSEYNYCYSSRQTSFSNSTGMVTYACECKDGFERDPEQEIDSLSFVNYTCRDIDECKSFELNDCDEQTSTCINLIGSYKCDCDKNYKRKTVTRCVELCSDDFCVNGDCIKLSDHEDFCQCHDDWKGRRCDQPNEKIKTYRTAIIISIVVAVIILILVVIGMGFYSRKHYKKRLLKNTAELRQELEMKRIDNQRLLRTSIGAETHTKHVQERGSDNLAFEIKH